MGSQDLLARFEEAGSGEEALSALDALAASGAGATPLADLYVRVADRLAEEDRHADAAVAQRRALEHGFDGVPDGREMLAWYLLKAGEEDEAGTLWRALEAERPDDADLLLTAGVAHRDAGRPEQAADLLARALEIGLRSSLDAPTLRDAAAERRAVLGELGREPEAIDGHAERTLERLERQADGDAIAVPWFTRAEYAVALERLPGFSGDWSGHDHAAYSLELDRRLREVAAVHGRVPAVVPVEVAAFVAFAETEGLDPDWAETRARYADERCDDALSWPVGRNDPCWCGDPAKYKRHCGA